jgi:hypothetical protein
MIRKSLFIFGPGGIGKSPLDDIIARKVVRIDPYRMRERPRDRDENGGIPDFFYANPKLRQELAWTFQNLGDIKEELSVEPIVEYYPKAKAAFFDVRGEWQCLLLGGLHAEHAKVEIFGPAVPPLLSRPDVQRVFGDFKIVILNPAESLRTLDGDYEPIRRKTVENCENAGRSEKDIKKRVASIDGAGASEVSSWLAMLDLGGIEYSNWEFPEYVYKEDRTAKLIDAKKVLLARYPGLESYFLSDDDIVKQGGNDA